MALRAPACGSNFKGATKTRAARIVKAPNTTFPPPASAWHAPRRRWKSLPRRTMRRKRQPVRGNGSRLARSQECAFSGHVSPWPDRGQRYCTFTAHFPARQGLHRQERTKFAHFRSRRHRERSASRTKRVACERASRPNARRVDSTAFADTWAADRARHRGLPTRCTCRPGAPLRCKGLRFSSRSRFRKQKCSISQQRCTPTTDACGVRNGAQTRRRADARGRGRGAAQAPTAHGRMQRPHHPPDLSRRASAATAARQTPTDARRIRTAASATATHSTQTARASR